MRFTSLVILVAILLSNSTLAARKSEEPPKVSVSKEIQIGMMSFADTWTTALVLTTGKMITLLDSPQEKLELRKFRYYLQLGAYDIAAGPHPGVSMLDMMVLSALTRRTWETYWVDRFGDVAQPAARIFIELETSVWGFSKKYLTAEQITALTELVDEWAAAHPKTRNASFIRLSNFGELERKPALKQAVKKGGLLSPIRDAAQSAEDITEMGERAIFLSMRMQELMLGRAEIMSRELLATPELKQLFGDVHSFQRSAERYAGTLEKLPVDLQQVIDSTMADVSLERQAALEQILDGFAGERSSAIEQMLAGVSAERELALKQTLDGLQNERVGMLKAVAHVLYWIELEMKSTVTRLFVVAAALIVLWFGLKTIYAYWVDRVADNFLKTLGVTVLFLMIAVPILLMGTYILHRVEPDFSQQADFSDDLMRVVEDVHRQSDVNVDEKH